MKKLITILFLGALWGFFEATLGGFLHIIQLPLGGQVMTAIGAGIMFFALAGGASLTGIVAISAVAASFKFFDIFLFGLPVTHITILNPAQAILIQGVAFAVCAKLVSPLPSNIMKRLGFAFSFAFLSLALFNVLSYYLVGYKPAFELSSILSYARFNLPVCAVLVTGVLFAADALGKVSFKVSFAMQGAATVALTAVAIIMRRFIA